MKAILFLLTLSLFGGVTDADADVVLPGLQGQVEVVRDTSGIPHIYAENEHDVFFMQGWVHAQDRLFQMDATRRQVAGRLAELFGPAPEVLELDVQSRTIGLHRAAERSLDAHPQSFRDLLQAYSDGVNAYIDHAEATRTLPPEYAALQLTSVQRWTPLDSVMVGKGLGAQTSLDPTPDIERSITLGTYQAVGAAAGFDGTRLFFEDLYRSAPFYPSATVPDAESGLPVSQSARSDGKHKRDKAESTRSQSERGDNVAHPVGRFDAMTLKHAHDYEDRVKSLARIPGVHQPDSNVSGGSNAWVISGRHTNNGQPLLANDMHLTLNSPTIFHQVHLVAPGIDVIGSSIAGAPCVVRGHNRHLSWGITNARLDINDVYAETIVPNGALPSGLSTLYLGSLEPIERLIESFSANVGGQVVPVLNRPVFIVPRRNQGPLITAPEFDEASGTLRALSLQSTGFSATRDPEGICGFNRATNLNEFKAALQLLDFASQNISYADKEGNIAYFVSGEVPLREDLQAAPPGVPVAPPFLIRNGSGGHEWIVEEDPPTDQAVGYAILPFEEMPQTVNPAGGVIINANNDQIGNSLDNDPLNDLRPGGGRYYLNWGGTYFSIRSGRIEQLIRARLDRREGLKAADMGRMQADVVMLDAQVFVPSIRQAFAQAQRVDAHPALAALAADPRVIEAVHRLQHWDYSTPTGIEEGYDAGDHEDDDLNPSRINDSVAATIYALWRHEIIAHTIDATLAGYGLPPLVNKREERVTALRHLLDNFAVNQGVGASGLNFFPGPADADAETRRDLKILQSLVSALDRLASDDFAAAFANSTDQRDYRWGRLHRIVFRHPLGGVAEQFNVPPAFGLFPAPLAGLAGIPVDGGFETVDVGSPAASIVTPGTDAFMFAAAATGRFVSQANQQRVKAVSSLPGGESADPASPFYLNLLEPWLRNEAHHLLVAADDVEAQTWSSERYRPTMP